MQAPPVYPTAPPTGFERTPEDVTLGASSAEGEGHVESPGKTKAVLKKVKDKAKKLRDQIKKVTAGSNSPHKHDINEDLHELKAQGREHERPPNTADEEGDDVDDGEEEDDEHILSEEDQSKYQRRLRSIGALDGSGDGSEVEVQGGVPASDVVTSLKSEADNASISTPLKSTEPPDGLVQATPPQYRSYAAVDSDPLLEGLMDMEPSARNEMSYAYSKYAPTDSPSLAEASSGGLPTTISGAVASDAPSDDLPSADVLLQNQGPYIDSPSAISGDYVPYPADLVKPNPEFGSSFSPAHHKVGVINEDLPVDIKLEAGRLVLEDQSGSSKYNILETTVPEDTELNDYGSTAPIASQLDEQVYRPFADPGDGSSLTSPPGNDKSTSAGADLLAKNTIETPPGDAAINQSSDMNLLPSGDARGGQSPQDYVSVGAGKNVDVGSVDTDTEGWGKWSVDKINNAKEAMATTLPGSSNWDVDHHPVDAATTNTVDGRGNWLADKVNNAVDAVTSKVGVGGGGTSKRPDTQLASRAVESNEGDHALKNGDTLPDTQFMADGGRDVDVQQTSPEGWGADKVSTEKVESAQDLKNIPATSEPGFIDDLSKDVDEKVYYDPNEIKDNQFQEGFTHAAEDAEEEAMNGTLTGSAIGKLQGLSDTVASTLGYGGTAQTHTDSYADSEGPHVESEGVEDSTSHPTSFVQGLRDTVTSTLGYGKPSASELFDHEMEGANLSPKKQETGMLQGLRNALASRLGYGSPSEGLQGEQMVMDESGDPSEMKESDTRKMNHEDKVLAVSSAAVENRANFADQPRSYTQALRDTTATAKDYLSSKVGYGGNGDDKEVVGTEHGDGKKAGGNGEKAGENVVFEDDEKPTFTTPDANSDQSTSYTQKLNDTTAAVKDYVTSKVGYGGNGNDDKKIAAGTGYGSTDVEKPGLENMGLEDREKPSFTARDSGEDQAKGYGRQAGENLGFAYGEKPGPNEYSEGDKPTYPSTTVSGEAKDKPTLITSSLAAPAEEDMALSQLITEKMSNTAAMLGQKLKIPGMSQQSGPA